MKTLKDQIIAADDRPFRDEDVAEWGVKIRVRGMSGVERDAYEAKVVKLRSGGQSVELQLVNFRARLIVRCLYDPKTDERIFDDDDDVAALGAKSGYVLDRLFDICLELSGMGPDAAVRAEGNSETVPSDGSTIG